MMPTPNLVLLPGMMADSRLFAPQLKQFPDAIVPAWPVHKTTDTLRSFAERLAGCLPQGPMVVVGVSFGGLVALELARFVDTQCCVVVSAVRSPREFPWPMRVLRPLGRSHPRLFDAATRLGVRATRPSLRPVTKRRFNRMLSGPNAEFYRWASWAVLNWQGTRIGCPVRQVHGSVDRTFPVARTKPDTIVEQAGHGLIMTHPRIVNDVIRESLQVAT